MGETDYNALLYDKMKAEQDKYRDWLLSQLPEEILNHTYCLLYTSTTFIVNVKQSESAKKPLNTVFQDICKHEVLGGFFTDKSFNLENPQKVS